MDIESTKISEVSLVSLVSSRQIRWFLLWSFEMQPLNQLLWVHISSARFALNMLYFLSHKSRPERDSLAPIMLHDRITSLPICGNLLDKGQLPKNTSRIRLINIIKQRQHGTSSGKTQTSHPSSKGHSPINKRLVSLPLHHVIS